MRKLALVALLCCPALAEDFLQADANGFRFRYSARISTEATGLAAAKRPLADASDHPGGVAPEHVYFRLKGPYDAFYESLRANGTFTSPPEIHFYPIEGFAAALAVEPRYVGELRRNVARFADAIRRKRDPKYVQDALFAVYPMMDVAETFLARPRFLKFKSGKGFSFLTQANVDTAPFHPDRLIYVFQGLSADGVYLVSATFPVHPIAEFPREAPAEFAARYAKDRSAYAAYLKQLRTTLESLPATRFDPPLGVLDDWIKSVEIVDYTGLASPRPTGEAGSGPTPHVAVAPCALHAFAQC